jgi:DNA-binding CsgD family transcriptional regulator
MTWVLSLAGGGSVIRSSWALLLYAPSAALCAWLGTLPTAKNTAEESISSKKGAETAPGSRAAMVFGSTESSADSGKKVKNERPASASRLDRKVLFLTACTLFLICLVKSLGFGFPSADVHSGISIELSRLVYAAGLICAGLLNDRSRRYGAVCTLAALVTPFLMLTLARESVSHIILWNIEYLAFGFFSVYRVLLFTDPADRQKLPCLTGAGLMIGRLGDALGNLLNHLLRSHTTALVLIASFLFALTVVLFVRMFQDLYLPAAQQKSDREIFEHFAVRHDLSVREKEVLRYLLDGCTNSEIAEKLFVSESTVKFHVHNLLQKTGCSGRAQLRSRYLEQR